MIRISGDWCCKMTYNEAYRKGIQILKEAGIEAPASDAGVLLCHAAGCERIFLYAHGDSELYDDILQTYLQMLSKRVQGCPLQYITGKQEFMSLIFEVGPGILIPRQETELLVETVIDACKDRKAEILDMCTGSGCIAVSLARYLPGCSVTAVDKMEQAIAAVRRNAEINGVSDRVQVVRSDLFSAVPQKKYDFIVSNPPYIRSGDIAGLQREVRDFEPVEALDGGNDGLFFYREIIRTAPAYTKSNGMLAFETGYDQAWDVEALMASAGTYGDIRILKDLAGMDRVVTARLIT